MPLPCDLRARAQRPRALPLAAVLACAGCGILPKHADDPAPVVRGPIADRIHHPVELTHLAFRPRSARTEAPGSRAWTLASSYTSLFQNGTGPGERVVVDGELWRNSAALRYGLDERTDVEVELALVYASSGFLDQFIETFHEILLLPDDGRDERPRFEYEVEIEHDGELAYELEETELGFGDLPIALTHRLVDEGASSPAVAVRAGIELPIGSQSKGFGNGGLDWGLGVLAERSWGRWTASGAVDWTKTDDASSFEQAGVDVLDDWDLQLGVEYRWSDGMSLLAGAILSRPITDDIGIEEVDSATLALDLGVAWDVGDTSQVVVAFQEDVISAAGPDFGVLVGWRFRR